MTAQSVEMPVEAVECSARPVFLPVGRVSERICIAMVGSSAVTGPWARATTPRPLASLPNDLGHAVFTFGNLVVSDFEEWCARGKTPQEWVPPITGLTVGEWLLVEGFDLEDVLRIALSMSGLAASQVASVPRDEQSSTASPRTSDERRFLD